jgi:dihydropteroate synthase
MKPGVARAALSAGASIVNDVAAASRAICRDAPADPMWKVVSDAGAGYVCMHMQGTPGTMQDNPVYADVVDEVFDYFAERLERLNDCGVQRDRVIFDVGIGFGKTLEHNLQLLGALSGFKEHGRPLLLGVSRKSFIAKLPGLEAAGRLPASLACAVLAVQSGVQIVRAHDVAETVQAIRMAEAILVRKK